MKFDVFYFDIDGSNGSQIYNEIVNCYTLNTQQVLSIYNQYKSCN